MKRFVALILTFVLVFSLTACGSNSTSSVDAAKNSNTDYRAYEDIKNDILKDEEQTISNITNKIEAINTTIDGNYENYVEAVTSINEWYDYSIEESNAFYERLNNYIIEYYKSVVADVGISDYEKWSEKVDDSFRIWSDVMDDYHNTWYKLYEDIYEQYSDIIEAAYDTHDDYQVISDAWNDMCDTNNDRLKDLSDNYDAGWNTLYENYNDICDGFADGNNNVDDILKK